MKKASGYVLALSKDRYDIFIDYAKVGLSFGEPVPGFQHSKSIPLVVFVTRGRRITHIATSRRGGNAGTYLRTLKLVEVDELEQSVLVSQVEKLLPKRNLRTVARCFSEGGMLTERGFAAVVAVFEQLIPDASKILNRYSGERTRRIGRLSHEARKGLAYQKETVLTALAIAEIGREPLQHWTPPSDPPVSFLDGLPSARLREDPMVVHDLMRLPGFDLLKTLPYTAAVFEAETERLTVILANRLPLEEQTGADLIYFNEAFQSFVMVQYKAMERDRNEHGIGSAAFRLPNRQLAAEIARMDKLSATLRRCKPSTTHHGYRMTDNPFFLKLCPRIVFNPDDIGLVPGMYLPLDYWKALQKSPHLKGSRGGKRVMFENVGRHLDNSAFVTVVSKAWVGTTPSQSGVLKDAIRETLRTGRTVAIAVKPKTAPRLRRRTN